MYKYTLIITLLAMFCIGPAYGVEYIRQTVPDAKIVGQARMKVMIWDVFDAQLYAPSGQWSSDEPFALKLSYLRPLEGRKIADKSIEEIRAQGFDNKEKIALWHTQMIKIFPDVDKGISITGVHTKNDETIFYRNADEIGRIKDPEFSRVFFNIWLGPKTSAPDLRRQLLGDK